LQSKNGCSEALKCSSASHGALAPHDPQEGSPSSFPYLPEENAIIGSATPGTIIADRFNPKDHHCRDSDKIIRRSPSKDLEARDIESSSVADFFPPLENERGRV